MLTRTEEIQDASQDHRDTFQNGAKWADQNPSAEILDTYNNIRNKLELCIDALNKIGLAQMGSLDYTEDFFELTKNIVRETLEEISK